MVPVSMSPERAPTYADLFAGCGGLSLGLEWAGFHRVAAIEISPDAAFTYYHNLICREGKSPIDWPTFLDSRKLQIETGLIVGSIERCFSDLLESCNKRSSAGVDLLAGGPPCQGYSTAGRRDPEDPRNALGDYMVKAVASIKPKAVLIENVPTIKAPFGRLTSASSPLHVLTAEIERQDYKASHLLLRASEIGVPQRRPRIFVIALRQDLFDSLPHHYKVVWQSHNGLLPFIRMKGKSTAVRLALEDLDHTGYQLRFKKDYAGSLAYTRALRFDHRRAVPAALSAGENIGRETLRNHELRKHRPSTIERFELYLKLKEMGIDAALIRWAALHGKSQLVERLRDQLGNSKVNVKARSQLIEELAGQIYEHRTKKHSQILLDAELPANTITTLPDDLVHYAEPRVLSVRELARIQSFPDSFVFKGKPTTGGLNRREEVPQYTQVGNAVPPIMARAIGLLIKRII